ncbi:MAG: glycosyltransferase [Candidatus Nanopelagicales bacterium]
MARGLRPGCGHGSGWWIESQLAPRLYRNCAYVAVSDRTRTELAELGVDAGRVHVIHNGIEQAPGLDVTPTPYPHIAVVGRLVPHKRVEHVLRAAAILRRQHPDLRVSVVGDGWWSPRLQQVAAALGVEDLVDFHGFVDEKAKHRIYASAWVLALPSLKEGWGIVVMEAATHGVPAVAYRDAGGVSESILDGTTGVLVTGDEQDFAQALAIGARFRGSAGTPGRRGTHAGRAVHVGCDGERLRGRAAGGVRRSGSCGAGPVGARRAPQRGSGVAVDDERLVDRGRSGSLRAHDAEGGTDGQDDTHDACDDRPCGTTHVLPPPVRTVVIDFADRTTPDFDHAGSREIRDTTVSAS